MRAEKVHTLCLKLQDVYMLANTFGSCKLHPPIHIVYAAVLRS